MSPVQIGSLILILIVAGFTGIPLTAISYFAARLVGREISVPLLYALVIPNGVLALLGIFGGESDGIPFMGSFIWASPATLVLAGACLNIFAIVISNAPQPKESD